MAITMNYSAELGAAICALLEVNGNLRETCRSLGLADSTVHGWLDAEPEFAEQYARAKAAGVQALADEIIAISDGRLPVPEGPRLMPLEAAARDRLRVDTRKWLLSKVLPKVYGEKVTTEHTGPNGGPIQHAAVVSDDELARLATGGAKP